MEDNSQNIPEEIKTEEEYHKEPKQNYVIYTIISVLLFVLVYSGFKYLEKKIFGDYKITLYENEITAETRTAVGDFAGFGTEKIDLMIITRTQGVYSFEAFVNSDIDLEKETGTYEEELSEEEYRLTVYPYGNEVPEYVYARCFVNINDPKIKCYTYDYGGESRIKIEASDPPREMIRLFSE